MIKRIALFVVVIASFSAAAWLLVWPRAPSGETAARVGVASGALPDRAQHASDARPPGLTAHPAPATAIEAIAPQDRAQYLETQLASPAGLSLQAARRASATQADFERLLDTLHDGYHADPEASETRRLFERQIGSAFNASDTGIALDRIACGLSICAASFTGRPTASMKFLGTLMDSGQDGKARIYSSNIRIAAPAPGDDRVGYRVIFSTDPATATLVEQR